MFSPLSFRLGRLISLIVLLAFLLPLTARNAPAAGNGWASGLPVVEITTTPVSIDSIDKVTYVPGTIQISKYKDVNNPGYGKDSLLSSTNMQTKGRGNATWDMPKKGYRIKFEADTPILPDMEPNKDWVLIANYADRTLIRYYAALELSKKIYGDSGNTKNPNAVNELYTPQMRYCELYWNGEYRGNYLIGDRIKVGPYRVNINKLKVDSVDISGGYILENDAENLDTSPPPPTGNGDKYFRTIKNGIPNTLNTPDGKDITDAQFAYIQKYVNDAETALYATTYKDPTNGYAKYFDVQSVINWFLVNEIYKNQDAKINCCNGSSVYWFKDTVNTSRPATGSKKLFMGPNWDFDFGAGNFEDSAAQNPTGWWVANGAYLKRFLTDTTPVTGFKAKIKARWLAKKLDIDSIIPLIDATAAALNVSQAENFKRWGPINMYIWPSPEEKRSYQAYVSSLKTWLKTRIAWMDSQIKAFPD